MIVPTFTAQGGIEIIRSNGGIAGTLGMITTSDGIDCWLLSAYHVLGAGIPAGLPAGERILHPVLGLPQVTLALTDGARVSVALDCAAAPLAQDIGADLNILLVGKPSPPLDPQAGMIVHKFGAATGYTQGYIDGQAGPGLFRILPLNPGDVLSDIGDSGAVWCEVVSNAAVLLHLRGSDAAGEFAIGRSMVEVLTVLDLKVA